MTEVEFSLGSMSSRVTKSVLKNACVRARAALPILGDTLPSDETGLMTLVSRISVERVGLFSASPRTAVKDLLPVEGLAVKYEFSKRTCLTDLWFTFNDQSFI